SQLEQLHRDHAGGFVRISRHETLEDRETLAGRARLTDLDRSGLHDRGDVLDVGSPDVVAGSAGHEPYNSTRERSGPSFSGLLFGGLVGVEGCHALMGSDLALGGG